MNCLITGSLSTIIKATRTNENGCLGYVLSANTQSELESASFVNIRRKRSFSFLGTSQLNFQAYNWCNHTINIQLFIIFYYLSSQN